MKSEIILNAIGQIDDRFIEEAAPKAHTTKNRGWAKWGAIAACAMLVLSIVFIPKLLTKNDIEPTPGDLRPMIFVNDALYFDTGTAYQNKLDNFIYIGEVASVVSSNEMPSENFQANYVSVGSDVYQYGNNIIIFTNNVYSEYEKAKDTELNPDALVGTPEPDSMPSSKTLYNRVKISFPFDITRNEFETTDSQIVAYIETTLANSLTPIENIDLKNSHIHQYIIELSNEVGGYSSGLYYDTLYDKAYLVRDGGLYEMETEFVDYIESL